MLITSRAPARVVTNLVSEHGSWSQDVCEITSGRVLFMGVARATLINERLQGF